MADLVPVTVPRTRLQEILDYGKGLLEKGAQVGREFKQGYATGERLLSDPTTPVGRTVFNPKYYQQLGEGAPARSVSQWVQDPETGKYQQQVRVEMAREPISPQDNPAAFAGAYTARVAADLGLDETRSEWWRQRHPMYHGDVAVEKTLRSPGAPDLTPPQKGLVRMAVFAPVIASTGIINIANPTQQFRPAGYAQTYADPESPDKRVTSQPGQELFDRFFLQHQGKPLPYEQAKQELPNLTPQQYGQYQKYLYKDKGLLDLGLIKGTMSNLQGYPEIRIANFPIQIPAATAIIGGNIGLQQAIKAGASPMRLGVTGFAGSVAGAAVGNVINELIARANRPKLPDLHDYQNQPGNIPLDPAQQSIG